MEIDYNWTYNQALRHIARLKQNYKNGFKDISSDDYKKTRAYIKSVRDEIYKINIKLIQVEALWSYMNDDIGFADLVRYTSRKERKNGDSL